MWQSENSGRRCGRAKIIERAKIDERAIFWESENFSFALRFICFALPSLFQAWLVPPYFLFCGTLRNESVLKTILLSRKYFCSPRCLCFLLSQYFLLSEFCSPVLFLLSHSYIFLPFFALPFFCSPPIFFALLFCNSHCNSLSLSFYF